MEAPAAAAAHDGGGRDPLLAPMRTYARQTKTPPLGLGDAVRLAFSRRSLGEASEVTATEQDEPAHKQAKAVQVCIGDIEVPVRLAECNRPIGTACLLSS
jgi:hypothetical protein